MPRSRCSAAALVAMACATAGCADTSATQLLVHVSTVPAEGLPLDAVEVEVQSEDTLTTWDRARFALAGAGGRITLPLSFGVAPRTRDLSGRVRVVARARLRGDTPAAPLVASALTSFVEGQRLLLPLVLDARCALYPPCGPGESCGPRGCASDARPPTQLRALASGEGPTPTPGATCARPAEACIDRCTQGARVAVARVFDRTSMRHALTTTPDTPACSGCVVETRAAFEVYPTPRPDLVPLFRCREARGSFLTSLREDCESHGTHEGPLGYVLSTATPGRCGAVPLYHLFDEATAAHYYTTRESERDRLLRAGAYDDAGVVAYVWQAPTSGCDEGFADCDGSAANACEANTRTSAAHCGGCGRRCPAGVPCSAGTCGCALGEVVCAGACTNLTADSAHCGGCGRACPANQVCRGGVCQTTCASGNTRCGSQCVTLGDNPQHCGACNNVCAVGSVCARGVCVPAASVDPIGCADGTREAFIDRASFPTIAGCAGAWALPGIFPAIPASPAAACATLGNSSTAAPADGAGCASSNLCAIGWHICNGGEVMPRTGNLGCRGANVPPRSFFAAAVSGPGCYRCALRSYAVTGAACSPRVCETTCNACSAECQENGDLNNDFFGCGTIGLPLLGYCDGLTQTPGNNCENVPGTTWRCNGAFAESRTVTKVGPANGGVLCCRE